jgi:hypothetical protein
MPYTEAEKTEVQKKMFGCTEADLEKTIQGMIDPSYLDFAISVLSDAQEVMMMDSDDGRVRQMINRAKWAISEVRSAERNQQRAEAKYTHRIIHIGTGVEPRELRFTSEDGAKMWLDTCGIAQSYKDANYRIIPMPR